MGSTGRVPRRACGSNDVYDLSSTPQRSTVRPGLAMAQSTVDQNLVAFLGTAVGTSVFTIGFLTHRLHASLLAQKQCALRATPSAEPKTTGRGEPPGSLAEATAPSDRCDTAS